MTTLKGLLLRSCDAPSLIRFRSSSSFVKRIRLLEALKEDSTKCQSVLQESHFMLLQKGNTLLSGDRRTISWLDYSRARSILPNLQESLILIGLDDQTPTFAITLHPAAEVGEDLGKFSDLRRAMFGLTHQRDCVALGKAWSLQNWHRITKFCASCGGKLAKSFSGHQRVCSSCQTTVYPTLSPVGIVLVMASDNSKVLLIRQPRYPKGMFSCIAGFVDNGETIEECVKREVAEEAGIEVDQVETRSSQHWPFPQGSLMIGCFAKAHPASQPDIDRKELEDAKWFEPKELLAALQVVNSNPALRVSEQESNPIFVPPKEALAHQLIRQWLKENGHLTTSS